MRFVKGKQSLRLDKVDRVAAFFALELRLGLALAWSCPLLAVARERPLLEALTVRTGKRKGERYAAVRPEVREHLERLGRERALIYKTLVLTGLRKGELASLTMAHLRLDDAVPCQSLDALTVISKDVQDSVLELLRQDSGLPVKPVGTVKELATTRDGFPFYHLPLGDVIHDLEEMDDQLDVLLSQTRSADLKRRD
jgi:integrase